MKRKLKSIVSNCTAYSRLRDSYILLRIFHWYKKYLHNYPLKFERIDETNLISVKKTPLYVGDGKCQSKLVCPIFRYVLLEFEVHLHTFTFGGQLSFVGIFIKFGFTYVTLKLYTVERLTNLLVMC